MSFRHYGTYQEPTKSIRAGSGTRIERLGIGAGHCMELDFMEGAGALNSWVPQPLVTTETGAATPFAVNATVGSELVCVTGATTDNGQELAGKKVGWNPSTMDGITLIVRAKFVAATTATDGDICIGFNDAVTETNSLAYVVSTASALTTHAPTDHASFYYSSIPTSGALYSASGNVWGFVTTKASTDTVTAPSTASVKDSSYHVFRLDIDSSGNATYHIDGVHVGTVASAVTANIPYTPYIACIAKNSHALTGTIDFIGVYTGSRA
jgi:hypothetical protein